MKEKGKGGGGVYLRNNFVEESLGVISDIRVVILIDSKRGACVMH
jgi:hypothetical protein